MQRRRTYALDNLRTFLTVLVIFHHAALAYGGIGSFSYRSPYHPPGSSIAAAKRSRATFLQEKFKRLGVPTLAYSVLGKGLIRMIICRRRDGADWADAGREFVKGVQSTRGVSGPMWYTALLLIFDTIYTIGWPQHFRAASPEAPSAQSSPTTLHNGETSEKPSQSSPTISRQLKTRPILIALTLTGLSSFSIRTHYPFGHIFTPLNLNLGYLPQYILYYTAGISIQRCHIALHRPCTSHAIAICTTLAAALLAYVFVNARTFIATGGTFAEITHRAGSGPNTFAFVYSLLNEFVGFTLSALLLRAFHSPFLSSRWTFLGQDIAQGSYAAFLVHIPVLVGIMTLVDEVKWKEWSPVVKMVGVGIVGVLKSWGLGMVVKRVVERRVGKGYL
ncbi:hypothetical protein BKA63DRAFT_418475 [Paraphoma chrysanthemicola]|nr:hypothetical protein BKA63DRAFT_418475 [Paraphoma chrysanthemicola]